MGQLVAPRPHDPALWLELRLSDELAELRRLRERGDGESDRTVRERRAAIDALLARWHTTRPCRWCLVERLDEGAGIELPR
jgi:hypothetical protein